MISYMKSYIKREYKMKKYVAIIPARGGSKGIPRKNIKEFNGRPLIDYTIKAAQGCSFISEVYISTEDEEIARVAKRLGAKVIVRPEEFATDDASTEAVLTHFVEQVDADYYVLLQATSPFTTPEELNRACYVIENNEDYDSLASFTVLFILSLILSLISTKIYDLLARNALMCSIFHPSTSILAQSTPHFPSSCFHFHL